MGKSTDLTGKKFGRWTVIRRSGSDKSSHVMWLCRCECGRESNINSGDLQKGHSQSCGCLQNETRIPEITGQRFGRLIVLELSHEKGKDGRSWWRCKCDCGNEVVVRGKALRNGTTRSCGCLRAKHGLSGAPGYHVWMSMCSRCLNPKHKAYKDYGGRGITICERWLNNPGNFLLDMGPRPGKGYSIDRIDVNGNYEPSNCRWATAKEQQNNRRISKNVKLNAKRRSSDFNEMLAAESFENAA